MTIDVIVQCIEEKFPRPQSHRCDQSLELIQPSPCVAPPDRFQQYIYSMSWDIIALAHRQVPTVFTLQGLIYLREKKAPVDPPGCYIAPYRLLVFA